MSVLTRNGKILRLFKLFVSLGLIIYLLWVVDWERAIEAIGQANKLLIIVSPSFWLFSLVAGSLRWRIALVDSEVFLRYRQAYTGYLVGTFYNIFLPGSIGGDAMRIALCTRWTKCKAGTATVGVFLERIAGVLALLSFLFSVSLLSPSTVSSLTAIGSTLTVAGAATVGVVVIVAGLMGRRIWMKWFPKNDKGIWSFVYTGVQAFDALRGRTLVAVFVLSALFQGMRVTGMFVLSRAIGLTLPLEVFFVVVPLVYLATLLPISLGGLGVREGALVFLLARFGATTSDAVTLSFLVYLNQVFIGILGGLVQLIGTFANRETRRGVKSPSLTSVPEESQATEAFSD